MAAQVEMQAPPGLVSAAPSLLDAALRPPVQGPPEGDTGGAEEVSGTSAMSESLRTASATEFKEVLVQEVTRAVQQHVDERTSAAVTKLWEKGEKAIRHLQREQASSTERLQGQLTLCAESYRNLERENAAMRQTIESLMMHLTMFVGPPPAWMWEQPSSPPGIYHPQAAAAATAPAQAPPATRPVSPTGALGLNAKYPKTVRVTRMDPCFEAPEESEEAPPPAAEESAAGAAEAFPRVASPIMSPPVADPSAPSKVRESVPPPPPPPPLRLPRRDPSGDSQAKPFGTPREEPAARTRGTDGEFSPPKLPSVATPPPSSAPPPAPTPPPTLPGAGCLGAEKAPTFTLTLRRADSVPLGLDVRGDPGDRYLTVQVVRSGGAVEAWNKQCAGDTREIRPGDCIIAINGVEDAKSMQEECLTKHLLRMTVLRGS